MYYLTVLCVHMDAGNDLQGVHGIEGARPQYRVQLKQLCSFHNTHGDRED